MTTVPLGEDLGIETSVVLKQTLAPHLAERERLGLDAGQVRRIHTASVQVLCAFVDARRKAGLDTGFDHCNDTFSDAVRLLGVAATLGLPVTAEQPKPVETPA